MNRRRKKIEPKKKQAGCEKYELYYKLTLGDRDRDLTDWTCVPSAEKTGLRNRRPGSSDSASIVTTLLVRLLSFVIIN